jgi:hypothetical protein
MRGEIAAIGVCRLLRGLASHDQPADRFPLPAASEVDDGAATDTVARHRRGGRRLGRLVMRRFTGDSAMPAPPGVFASSTAPCM